MRNADHKGMGPIPFEDAIAFSRNVATAKVAMELGDNTTDSRRACCTRCGQRLGIGRPTGIDLANEAAGIASDPDTTRWADIDLANRAFGQAVAVTPLQLAVAFSAMANGGRLVQPHLVASVDGKPTDSCRAAAGHRRRPVAAPAAADDPRADHADRCCTAHTAIPGYTVGGKTGTAQFWDARPNAWATDAFNYTFCGFVGRETPDLMIVVRINEAQPTVQKRNGGRRCPRCSRSSCSGASPRKRSACLDLPPLPGFDPSAQPTYVPATDATATPTPTLDAGASDAPATDALPTESPDAAGYYPDWAQPSPTAEP